MNGEIDTWGQFHQHSTRSFYAQRSRKRKYSAKPSVSFYTFGIYERNAARKMLMKLTPGFNFFNILGLLHRSTFLRQKITKPKCN